MDFGNGNQPFIRSIRHTFDDAAFVQAQQRNDKMSFNSYGMS